MKRTLVLFGLSTFLGALLFAGGCGSKTEEVAAPTPKEPPATQLPSESKPGMLGEPKLNPEAGTTGK